MNYTLYQNGILRVYTPHKGRNEFLSWGFDWRKVDDFLAPFLIIGLLIIVWTKL